MESELLGRDAELTAVDRFLDEAGTKWSALVVEGEAGIGKTTLWREAGRRAEVRGFTVLACRPTEAEAKLSFAALADLLEPVSSSALARLPDPQRRALEVALLQADFDAAGEPRAVAAGVRSVLAGLAATGPVLVAVDDMQWLDDASAAALAFALRRFEAEPIGLLATQRPGTRRARRRLETLDAQRLELDRLSVAAIHELLKRRLGRSFPRPLLLRLHEVSGGNPFFALEIGRELFHTGVGPGDPLPVPKDLRRLVRRRLGRLSPAANEMLLVAAAVGEPTRALVSAALETDVSDAIEEAERAEIIEFDGAAIRFSHPLYATATYLGMPPEGRRRLHGRLGKVVPNPEEQARHLALATEAPSRELAARLDEAALLAERRGAPGVAAELSDLALTRTPSGDEARQDRVLDLVSRLQLAADSDRALGIARAELPRLVGPSRRVQAYLLLSELAMWTVHPSWEAGESPVSLAEHALAEAGDDASLAARAHTVLATVLESDLEASFDHACRALELVEHGAVVQPAVHAEALSAFTRCKLFRGEGLDVRRLEQAIDLERSGSLPRLVHDRTSYKLAQWLKYVDEFERARAELEQSRRDASDEGDDLSPVNILINLVILECWAGRWAEAHALGAELVQRFRELGWTEPPSMHVALTAALSGDAETVRTLEEVRPAHGVYDVIRLRPLGLLALSESRVDAAWLHYRRALDLIDGAGIREPAIFRIHADAIESAISAGALEEGARVADSLDVHAQRSSIPWNRATAARSRALVLAAQGRVEHALQAAEVSLHEHERVPMPFELARTFLVKGQLERRIKRKSAAKASLERALAIFQKLGAPLWEAKAHDELARVGLRPRARDDLTETERRVAELAASGLKNREVAAKLFLSPKTVDANLARVYRKLGIRSRAELGARLAGVDRRT